MEAAQPFPLPHKAAGTGHTAGHAPPTSHWSAMSAHDAAMTSGKAAEMRQHTTSRQSAYPLNTGSNSRSAPSSAVLLAPRHASGSTPVPADRSSSSASSPSLR